MAKIALVKTWVRRTETIEQRKRKNDDITFFQIKVFFEGPKVLKLLCKKDYVIQSFTLIFGS